MFLWPQPPRPFWGRGLYYVSRNHRRSRFSRSVYESKSDQGSLNSKLCFYDLSLRGRFEVTASTAVLEITEGAGFWGQFMNLKVTKALHSGSEFDFALINFTFMHRPQKTAPSMISRNAVEAATSKRPRSWGLKNIICYLEVPGHFYIHIPTSKTGSFYDF